MLTCIKQFSMSTDKQDLQSDFIFPIIILKFLFHNMLLPEAKSKESQRTLANCETYMYYSSF